MNTSQAALRFLAGERKIAVLPIGSCEQHGPYLPVTTDLLIASLLAEQLVQSFPEYDTLLLPAMPFSCSHEHRGLGTIALDVSTVAAFIHNVARGLNTWGTPFLLVLVNWHGGNDLLGALATEITSTESLPCAAIPSTAQVGRAWEESGITTAKDIHAGAVETSIVQAYWPHLTAASLPSTAHDEPHIAPAKVQPVLQAIGSYSMTKEGIWGAPEQADAAKGKQLIEQLAGQMHEQVAGLLALVNEHTNR